MAVPSAAEVLEKTFKTVKLSQLTQSNIDRSVGRYSAIITCFHSAVFILIVLIIYNTFSVMNFGN